MGLSGSGSVEAEGGSETCESRPGTSECEDSYRCVVW